MYFRTNLSSSRREVGARFDWIEKTCWNLGGDCGGIGGIELVTEEEE
jgi:hypothetical protein